MEKNWGDTPSATLIDIIQETYNVYVENSKNFNEFWHNTLYLYKP